MSSLWPYHFISLSESDKLHRRDLLDLRGHCAQWSIVLAMIAVRVFQGLATASGKTSKPARGLPSWWDRPLVPGWIETRRQYFICGLWLSWLLSLSVWNSGEADYLHLTKALGHVGLSQIPLQALMSPAAYISTIKPGASSLCSVLTGISQPILTPYHRLFGRVVVLPLLLAHATLYMAFFVQNSHPEFGLLVFKRVRDSDVQCGLVAISSVAFLFLFARPRGTKQNGLQGWLMQGPVQERRRMFYLYHVFLVAVLCGAAYCHVKQAQKYMIQTLVASVLNGVCSWAVVQWGGRR
ncbi:hypothetical protein N7460_005694 [Penicillium canescens]|uniref:Ferric oxidoreductase domain-containing protein n=1 Tax=Penicillium canescens TaxID=5083 RepID=A0AAD6IG24_PENCN|nr:hypothetical protein N7460_005694 [Penicillium canescens]